MIQSIGHFKVLDKLGSGGMGDVYLALDQVLGRRVAIKTIRPETVGNATSQARFLREARSIAALSHPNIAILYDAGQSEHGPYLVMEYIDGQSLRALLAAGPVGETRLRDYGAQIASALAHAHERGIIHRDIKPANVMINSAGTVKLLDFGLAKAYQAEAETLSQLTEAGTVPGTPHYIPPELLGGAPADIRSDIYSFGVLLYEMACGQLPFSGLAGPALIAAILRGSVPPVQQRNPTLSRSLQGIIARAMALNRDERYAGAAEIEKTIRSGETVPAPPQPQVSAGKPTVAVLDFANVSGDASVSWLGTGIAETLTADLKKLKPIRVVSRERVLVAFRAAGPAAAEDPAEIGRRLGVQWLIQGGYQRAGNRLRITPQVIDVASGELLATAKIDGDFEDLFDLQDRLVSDLMALLEVQIDTSAMDRLAAPETRLLEAYEAYAEGRRKAYELTKESLEASRQLYERAIALDPGYAMAHEALGAVYAMRFIHRTDPDDLTRAVAYLERALELDPDLGEPYPWLCYIYARQGKLALAAEAGRRGVALQSDLPRSHYLLGVAYLIAAEGDPDQVQLAVDCFGRAIAADSRWEPAWMFLGWIAVCAGDHAAADRYLARSSELVQTGTAPSWVPGAETSRGTLWLKRRQLGQAEQAYQEAIAFLQERDHIFREPILSLAACGLGDSLLRGGKSEPAMAAYRRALSIAKQYPRMLGQQRVRARALAGMAAAGTGDRSQRQDWLSEAAAILADLEGQPQSWMWEAAFPQLEYGAAVAYLRMGDIEAALDRLGNAVSRGWRDAAWLEADPELAPLRSHPRFQPIVAQARRMPRLQLPDPALSSASHSRPGPMDEAQTQPGFAAGQGRPGPARPGTMLR